MDESRGTVHSHEFQYGLSRVLGRGQLEPAFLPVAGGAVKPLTGCAVNMKPKLTKRDKDIMHLLDARVIHVQKALTKMLSRRQPVTLTKKEFKMLQDVADFLASISTSVGELTGKK
jgi:hypothetical protein